MRGARVFKRIGAALAAVLAVPLLLAAVSQFTAVISLPDIATMRGLGAASQFYPNIIVTQYNTSTGYGGDVFRWDPTSTASADSCTVFTASGVSTGRWIRQLYGKPISVEDCGAYNDGTHASATLAAFQAANDYVAASANPNQFINALGASYAFGSGATGVVKAASNSGPNWVGGGAGQGTGTVISFTPSAEAAAFTFVGGSGADCGCSIKGFVFSGNSNTIGVEIQGQDSMSVNITEFNQGKLAVLLHNKLTGQFTENNHLVINSVGSALGTVVEYRVASGDASFHGSGITGGFINFGAGGAPAILVGSGAFFYNAPLDGATFFPVGTTGAAVVVQNNSATAFGEPWFSGNVRVEMSTASSVVFGAGNSFFLAGSATSLGPSTMGTMYTGTYFASLLSGQRVGYFSPFTLTGATTGATTTISYPDNTKWNNYVITCEVTGTNYDGFWIGTTTYIEASGGWNVSNVDQPLPTNTAGYGKVHLAFNTGSSSIALSGESSSYPAGLRYNCALAQVGQGINHTSN